MMLALAGELADTDAPQSDKRLGNKTGSSPMRRFMTAALILAVFLVALPLVVHWQVGLEAQTPRKPQKVPKDAPPPRIVYGIEGLPQPVRELRDAMMEAVQSGRIEELRYAYDLNDIKPDLAIPRGSDPVAHWKRLSGDGEGREILAMLSLVLDSGYVVLPLGADPENNRLYIWPYFAEVPLGTLTPSQEVELLRLVPPAKAKEMKASGKYTHWRIAIGADGSWHSFRKDD